MSSPNGLSNATSTSYHLTAMTWKMPGTNSPAEPNQPTKLQEQIKLCDTELLGCGVIYHTAIDNRKAHMAKSLDPALNYFFYSPTRWLGWDSWTTEGLDHKRAGPQEGWLGISVPPSTFYLHIGNKGFLTIRWLQVVLCGISEILRVQKCKQI